MILNNFKKILLGTVSTLKPTLTLINGSAVEFTRCIQTSGDSTGTATFLYEGGNSVTGEVNSDPAFSRFSIAFGSGLTEATADDYQMETPLDTTNNFNFNSCTETTSEGGFSKTLIAAITNTQGDNLTISEIGIVSKNGNGNNEVLLTRDVISPVTLSSGETRVFQCTIDFSGL